ncbi:MAG: ACP S-malonyltransferase [Gemmatimonadaceae bacterium]
MDVVLLFPGQGSQKPGMGKDLYDTYQPARDTFDEIDRALGEPLSQLCFAGPAETLTLTHNAQVALLAHGVAAWAVVRERLRPHVRAAAGHSLGEFTAHAVAGSFSLADAARIVRRRGELMHEAGSLQPGMMAAILGDLTEPIDVICARASSDPEGGIVVPANYNAPAQTVISGEVSGVEKAMQLCKDAGAKRALKLNVSGAFHSPLMAPARDGLHEVLAHATMHRAGVPVYANVSTEPVCDPATARALLVEQLTAPVRWIELVQRLARDFPNALCVELGPGSALVGLVKRIVPNVKTMTCGTAAEVEQLLATVA